MNSTDRSSPPTTRGALKQVLFVCVGNSCRSQMAEGFANRLAHGRMRVWSAGLFPLGRIEPSTRAVMEERGISLAGQTSKGIDEVPFEEMDVVVAMGSGVVSELLESLKDRLVKWEIPDPFRSDLDRYRTSRDLIEAKVRELLAELAP